MKHLIIFALLVLNLISCERNDKNQEVNSSGQSESQYEESSIAEDNGQEDMYYEINISDPTISDITNFPPIENDPERCKFSQYMYAVYDCSDVRSGKLDPNICIEKLEKLIEDYPDFYCESYHVRHDGSLIEISIKTRKDIDALLEEMLKYL